MAHTVALVTGASSGIGKATVRELVKGGGSVVAVARRGERLEALAGEVGDSVLPVVADITDAINEFVVRAARQPF